MHVLPFLAVTACLGAAPAFAQDPDIPAGPPPGVADGPPGDMITVGLGGAYGPDYSGSDDYRLIPGGIIRASFDGVSIVNRGLRLYADVGPEIGDNLSLNVGPIVGLRLNRTGDVEDEIVDRLPERETAIEVGGFIGLTVKQLTNPFDSLSFRLDAYHDINGSHDDLIISPAVDFSTPLSFTTFVSAGLSAEFVGGDFADTYFGITPAEALLVPELGEYDPDGGFKSWSASLLVGQSLEDDLRQGWSIFGTVIYTRLQGDFADSPLVADRGNPNQFFLAAGIGYTF
ncbi:MAG: MipA/OmpV family protein [Sphingomonas sp.]|nr:MipA/OmpV family protein [Sphingomonas sp.]